MPEAVATLRIVGKDQVSSELKKVQASLKSLSTEAQSSKGSFGSLNELLGGLGGRFGLSAGALGAGAAGGAIAYVGIEAYKAADALQVMENQAKGVFGEAFPRMQASSANLSGELRRSSSDMLQMETGFGAIFKGAGIAGSEMESLSEQLTRTSVAFGNFTGLADSEAFDLVQGGVLGMGKALQRYGIFVNDATLQEYAHAKGIKAKVDEMSDAQKMFLRANMIQDQTNKLMGEGNGQTKTARSEWKALKGQINDAFEVIGKPVLTVATAAMSELNDTLSTSIGMWSTVSGAIGGAYNQLKGFATLAAQAAGFDNAGIVNYSKNNKNVAGVNADNVKQIGHAMTLLSKAKDKEVVDYFQSLGGAMKDTAGEAEKIKDAMEELGSSYDKESRAISNSIDELERNHRQKMKDMGDQMEDLQDRLKDLAKDFQREMSGIDVSEADVINRAEDKIKDLEKKRGDLLQERDSLAQRDGASVGPKLQQDLADVEAELAKERQGLANIKGKAGSDVLGTAQERGALTDSERSFADLESRRSQRTEDHNQEIADTNDEIAKVKEKMSAEEEAYTQTRQQLELTRNTLNVFRDDYNKAMTNISSVTETTVKNLKKDFEDLQSTIANIDALVAARSDLTGGGTTAEKVKTRRDARLSGTPDSFLVPNALGGIYDRPTAALIGEAGYKEAVIPMPFGNIPVKLQGAVPSSSKIEINISSMVIREEADINRVASQLARMIQLTKVQAA